MTTPRTCLIYVAERSGAVVAVPFEAGDERRTVVSAGGDVWRRVAVVTAATPGDARIAYLAATARGRRNPSVT